VRKSILFVDACVPAADKSAGDYRAGMLIDLLCARYRVHFLALEKDATPRRYTRMLAAKGVDIVRGVTAARPAAFRALLERLAVSAVLFNRHRTAFPLLFHVPHHEFLQSLKINGRLLPSLF
jgi:hypothetical protein